MVMHASKHPRLSDGFHDRNEAHPFQTVDRFPAKSHSGNSDSTQGSMSTKTGDHTEQRERLHISSKDSPNQRPSVSPGTRQTNDRNSPRMYRNKESYLQRQREKQKSLGSSPAENAVNHHGTNSHVTEHEKHIKTILAKAGEWTEHTSSSGKKYYYNCRTEVSQWEKPREWLEREKLQRALGSKEKPVAKESPRPAQSGDTTPSKPESASTHADANNKHSNDSTREKPTPSPLPQQTNRYADRPSSKTQERPISRIQDKPATTSTSTLTRCYSAGNTSNSSVSQKRPLLSSQSTYSSTVRSQNEGVRTERNRKHDSDYQNREQSAVNDKPRSSSSASMVHPSSAGGRVAGLSLATDIYGRLKPLVSYPRSERDRTESPQVRTTPSPGTPNATPSPLLSKSHHNNQSNQQGLHPPVAHKLFPARSPSIDRHGHPHQHTDRLDDAFERLSNQSPISVASVSDLSSPAISQQSPRNHTSTTPLLSHSQSQSSQSGCNSQPQSKSNSQSQSQSDSETPTSGAPSLVKMNKGSIEVKQEQPQVVDSEDCKSVGESQPLDDSKQPSPVSTSPTPSQTSNQSGTGISSLPTTPQKPTVITLTPSLALHYDESLIKHGTGWPSEVLERQAQRLFEESHTLGAELSAQVSADLKFARSLVRASEIQATLQEQRVLFLRQQAKDLEKLRNENAYMT